MSAFISQGQIYQDRNQRPLRMPSDRFSQLLINVFAKHGVEFDPESVMKGSQFSYIDLLAQGISAMPIAAGTEVIVFTSCALEFDPKQPGIGAAFLARFGNYDLHSVCNEGIVGGFTALHLANQIVRHQNRKVCLLAVEQDTNPLPKHYEGFAPTENIIGMLDLRGGEAEGSWQIVSSGVIHPRGLGKKLDELTKLHGLSHENLTLHFKDPAPFEGFLNDTLRCCERELHNFPASIALFAQCLVEMSAAAYSKPFALLLLEDVFSKNCGALLCKRSGG